jgi:hypothetical protein
MFVNTQLFISRTHGLSVTTWVLEREPITYASSLPSFTFENWYSGLGER